MADVSPDEKPAVKAPNAADSMREKMTLAFFGFILTGIVGGMLTTWIQQRGWAWQNRVARIEKDVDNVVTTYKSTSELINLRWHASYRMVRASERGETGATLRDVRAQYDLADREWALHYANVARDVEFYVDAPFGLNADEIKQVWLYSCADSAQAPIRTQSARVLLELANHCGEQLKSLIEPLTDGKETPNEDAQPRKNIIDNGYKRLDQLYKMNDQLRCVIFDRSISIRNSLASQSYWSTFFGIAQNAYVIGQKSDDCR